MDNKSILEIFSEGKGRGDLTIYKLLAKIKFKLKSKKKKKTTHLENIRNIYCIQKLTSLFYSIP